MKEEELNRMADSPKSNGRPSPDEYRRALLRERRRTMRTVRNSLLAVAALAARWFLVLLARERMAPNPIKEGDATQQSDQNITKTPGTKENFE